MTYSIKQISEKTNLKPHVLRYYEREGLLPHVYRTENGVRRYSKDDLEWLSLILCLKHSGMSIKQIKNFVELSFLGNATLKERCTLLQEHKKNIEDQMKEMEHYLDKVTHKINYYTSQYEDSISESI